MKISNFISLLALAAPFASALKGVKKNPEAHEHRVLKGDDGGGIEIPDIEDIVGDFCFSEVATVQVQDKGAVSMKDLAVGDRVLTQTGTYEPVYAFGHYNPTKETEFLQLKSSSNVLEITSEHMVFLQGKSNPVRAGSVRAGQVLQSLDNSQQDMTVTKVNTVTRQGVYAPLTTTGTVVVDGVVASSYISLQKDANEFVQVAGSSTGVSQQHYVHWTLSPLRMLCQGVSSNFCTVHDNDGMPHYVSFGIALHKWASDCGSAIVHSLVLFVVAVLVGACMVLENTFGATFAPLALVLMGGAYAMMKSSGVSVRANKCKTV